ncbi:glycosyltransferase family 1 protein [Cryobacterium sp. MLB-32]|uniref:rhamnosyltransferase WsaF family glycosyltransferase n=1 Tax=Cryobacterium sp. MLB-32 TaxID=1529318 RepID=UPI00068C764D|nr:glycosyltransferase family 1 protein [Cryobacterium sp. MLB-32]
MTPTLPSIGEHSRQLGSRVTRATGILRTEGPRVLAQRLARYSYKRLGAASLDEPLFDDDIADSTQLNLLFPERRPPRSQPLRIGWVMVPPSAGSGGHTTLFRMVEALERAGHRCVLFLYDRYGGDTRAHERVIRDWWPNIQAEVRDAADGISGIDACVASGWETAHVLARRGTAPMQRLYFIQDYEPYFYAHGSMYSLAEDSYRFGFRTIALGEMVAMLLRSEIGILPDITEFGCDTSVYRLLPERERSGVVLFARPEVPRRGYALARLALQRFHGLHPEVPIHIYGSEAKGLPFPATQHGRLTPTALNELYNSSIAGLAMSFTNISLVAEEMLAAGTIPVVNDSVHSRADLVNDHVRWATPTPHGIAAALSAAVTRSDVATAARAASESVRQIGWTRAQADVVRIVEDEVYGS